MIKQVVNLSDYLDARTDAESSDACFLFTGIWPHWLEEMVHRHKYPDKHLIIADAVLWKRMH
jgi:hypothetical protein